MARRFVLAADQPRERADKLLARLCPELSRTTLQRWIREGRVRVDGNRCRPRDLVGAGSSIDVEPAPAPPSRAEPDPGVQFEVLFEDPYLVVVNKPAGLVVHPARGHPTKTLVNGLLARPGFSRTAADPRDPQGAMRPGVVHRLDKDTSGVLVVAKDASSREGLKQQLASHRIERCYRALTLGVPESQTISTQHARHPCSRLRFTSRVTRGRAAVTRVTTLEPLAGGRAALVECHLQTGRTHQIRVHLAERTKTPVLADALYGTRPSDPELRAVEQELGRHALHAAVLGFEHPMTGQWLRLEASFPIDLQRALQRLRQLST
jgi:23S rRNA pseudouridine1911/1915/1917 synthase